MAVILREHKHIRRTKCGEYDRYSPQSADILPTHVLVYIMENRLATSYFAYPARDVV